MKPIITYLKTHHNHIIANGGSYEDDTYRRHAIAALSSGPNASFNKFIGDINHERGGKELFYGVEKWCTEKNGDTIVHEGTTYTWCPHHKHPNGHYSGLYYKDHSPSTHDKWRKTRRYKKSDEKTAAVTDGSNKKKLTIANELKTAFATNLSVSEEDIKKIIAKANAQEN
jgi:hypothetical protein